MAEANITLENRLDLLEKILEGKYKIIGGMINFKENITVPEGEGIPEEILKVRGHANAFKEPITNEILYKRVEISVDISSGSLNLKWDKWIICSLSLKGKGEIRVIDFFTDRDEWERQNPTDFYESSKEYPIGIIGLNLIYFFINQLKLGKKLVSDSHLSIREWKQYKSLTPSQKKLTPWKKFKSITKSTYWNEFDFSSLVGKINKKKLKRKKLKKKKSKKKIKKKKSKKKIKKKKSKKK